MIEGAEGHPVEWYPRIASMAAEASRQTLGSGSPAPCLSPRPRSQGPDIAHNTASILGVQINLNVNRDDAGSRPGENVLRSAARPHGRGAGGKHLLHLQDEHSRDRSRDGHSLDQGRGEQRGNLDGGRLMTVARLTQASVEVLG